MNCCLYQAGGGNGFLAGQIFTAPSGRKYARHISGMGSVMFWNDGIDRMTLILDAMYRSAWPWARDSKSIPQLTGYDLNNTLGNHGLDGTYDTWSSGNFTDVTDTRLNNIWSTNRDANTSRQNCDIWLSVLGSVSAAPAHARSILVNGQPCDIPNVQTAIRIACDANFIDQMDSTVTQYPSKALGTYGGKNFMNIDDADGMWTSTKYGNAKDILAIRISGCWYYYQTNCSQAVVPILELAA